MPCAVSWPPIQSVSSTRSHAASAPGGGERRGDAAGAATDNEHVARDVARGWKVRHAHDGHGRIAVHRHPHDVDEGIKSAIICQRAMVLGSQSAICGKAMTSPSTTIWRMRYGQIDPKIWLSVMPGGVTPLR